jgi:hypothetical protein
LRLCVLSIVYIFHFVAFLRNNTREMYRLSPHLQLQVINVSVGGHKEAKVHQVTLI